MHAVGAMPLHSKRSPAEGEFLFEMDDEPSEERAQAAYRCWCARPVRWTYQVA